MQIKQLTHQELNEILHLDGRFKSHWSKDTYLERLELFPDLAYGAYIDGKLIGFILGKREDEHVMISRIVVQKQFEGQGIGSKLLKVFLTCSNRFRSIVRVNNLRSVNLHMHHGFAVYSNYEYANGDQGFILQKY